MTRIRTIVGPGSVVFIGWASSSVMLKPGLFVLAPAAVLVFYPVEGCRKSDLSLRERAGVRGILEKGSYYLYDILFSQKGQQSCDSEQAKFREAVYEHALT